MALSLWDPYQGQFLLRLGRDASPRADASRFSANMRNFRQNEQNSLASHRDAGEWLMVVSYWGIHGFPERSVSQAVLGGC